RRIVLSGRTEADKRAVAMARAAGVIQELRVRRGSQVKKGEVIAVLSDEAREAHVMQAQARLVQRRVELQARLKLIEQGNLPALQRPQLEAEMKAAEAALAAAEAERLKGEVLAPISGIVNDVPVEVGQALQANANVAEVIASDPMLAVAEIAERQLGGVKVGDPAQVRLVTGMKAEGTVRFISQKASQQTRTYRIEIALANLHGDIPDGVTAEVALSLAPVPATRVPRSALTFSSEGKLGVRIVTADGTVAFVPVGLIEDGPGTLWVSGIAPGSRLIVQGQDFVREGVKVDAVPFGGAAS
ncbi:MAG TPA: efflux RND transporter periplasmic adaptor subunit, partial [Beijerinckiaceae bacterium]|nr:efflux RND transporter periplasmic adaptor subunit [Beijerinckiaceae bacterium]